MGETAMSFSFADIITNATSIITALGTNFTSLNSSFGFVLFIPVALAMSKSIVGMIKSVLFFRRGKRR